MIQFPHGEDVKDDEYRYVWLRTSKRRNFHNKGAHHFIKSIRCRLQPIAKKAAMYGLNVAELLQNFIGDLVDGIYSNGSDERMMAQDWFDRCRFGIQKKKTLLRHLIDYDYDIEDLLATYNEDIYSKERPEELEEEHAELDEGEALWFENDLKEMLEDWKPDEGRDRSKEVGYIKEYLEERKNLLG